MTPQVMTVTTLLTTTLAAIEEHFQHLQNLNWLNFYFIKAESKFRKSDLMVLPAGDAADDASPAAEAYVHDATGRHHLLNLLKAVGQIIQQKLLAYILYHPLF